MSTVLYNPGIRIYVDTRARGKLDLTDDIESGSLTINENNRHALNFVLSNAGGKYQNTFTPNDKVIVQMKRVRWLQVFSGYLDTVPYFNVFHKSLGFSATCTMKRVYFHWWDPGYVPTLVELQKGLTNQTKDVDAGMSGVIKNMLTDIIGWDPNQIHIGTIPIDWMTKIVNLWSDVQAEVNNQMNAIGGLVVAGSTGTSDGSLVGPNGTDGGPPPQGTNLPMVHGTASYYDLTSGEGPSTPGAETGTIPLHVDNWWSAMHWGYAASPQGQIWTDAKHYLSGAGDPKIVAGDGKTQGAGRHLLVSNAQTNVTVCVRAADYMADASSNDAIDLSPTAFQALGFTSSQGRGEVNIAWAPQGAPVGPYKASATKPSSSQPSGTVLGATGAIAAANFAISKIGVPYGRSGIGPNEPSYDCSSLVASAWQAAGQTLQGSTQTQWADTSIETTVATAQIQPGDLLYVNNTDSQPNPTHVGMYVGNNTVVDAPSPGQVVHATALDTWMGYWKGSSGSFAGARRVVGTKGGQIQSTGVLATVQGVATSGSGTQTGNNGQLLVPNWMPAAGQQGDWLSSEAQGLKLLMNDSPIMPTLTSIVQTGLRSYCSAPNGDFIAWFPDYFGNYGYAAKWYLSPVEMMDFQINWSDINMVTHQFTAGSVPGGTYNTTYNPANSGAAITEQNMIQSYGVATIDIPGLFDALFNIDVNSPKEQGLFSDVQAIYQQFGPRINYQAMPTVPHNAAEFWYAIRLWTTNWASQFSTTVPMTFMPELWPGMLLVLQEFGFQAYITSVTHSWSMQDEVGFSTRATVIAPSALDGSGLVGLARGK